MQKLDYQSPGHPAVERERDPYWGELALSLLWVALGVAGIGLLALAVIGLLLLLVQPFM